MTSDPETQRLLGKLLEATETLKEGQTLTRSRIHELVQHTQKLTTSVDNVLEKIENNEQQIETNRRKLDELERTKIRSASFLAGITTAAGVIGSGITAVGTAVLHTLNKGN